MTTTTAIRHACARCGKKQPAELMVFSTHTRSRYCRDIDACATRAKRRRRA